MTSNNALTYLAAADELKLPGLGFLEASYKEGSRMRLYTFYRQSVQKLKHMYL